MKTLVITQARFGSSRLPGKVLKTVGDKTLLDIHLERLKKSRLADQVLVATTSEPEAVQIVEVAEKQGCLFFQGSTANVLDRFYQAARIHHPETIVRVTSDCPLNDASVVDEVIREFVSGRHDYFSNIQPPTFPDGLDVEVFRFSALESAWKEATEKFDQEHVTPFIRTRPERFKLGNLTFSPDLSAFRLTVDHEDDFQLLSVLIHKLGYERPWIEYIDFLKTHPEFLDLNRGHQRNEGSKQ